MTAPDPDPSALPAVGRLSRANIARHAASLTRRWSRSGWLAAPHVERIEAALARELDAMARTAAGLVRHDMAKRAQRRAARQSDGSTEPCAACLAKAERAEGAP